MCYGIHKHEAGLASERRKPSLQTAYSRTVFLLPTFQTQMRIIKTSLLCQSGINKFPKLNSKYRVQLL